MVTLSPKNSKYVICLYKTPLTLINFWYNINQEGCEKHERYCNGI